MASPGPSVAAAPSPPPAPAAPAAAPRKAWWESGGVWLLAALLFGLAGGIGYGVAVLLAPASAGFVGIPVARGGLPARDSTALPPELELRYQLLKERLDDAADNSRRTDRLITLLLTLTSLYAIALGLNSYFGLKQILDNGKEELGRLQTYVTQSQGNLQSSLQTGSQKISEVVDAANKQLADFRVELRNKYPELANLHENLRDLLNEMRLMFQPGHNWTTQYGELVVAQRQKIELAEIRIAGLEVFRLGELESFREDVRRVYQGLGRFYSSRYKEEKQRAYWERASLYFDTAVELDSVEPPAELMKDLGVHLTLIEQLVEARKTAGSQPTPEEIKEVEALRLKAEQVFVKSLKANPVEPGALFGLGWLLYKRQEFQAAIDTYAKLTGIPNLSASDRKKYLDDAYFNQACCYSLMAKPNPADAAYGNALTCLTQSKAIAKEFNRLTDWIPKVEKESAQDLRPLAAAKQTELAALLT
jgi:hypothetical protein